MQFETHPVPCAYSRLQGTSIYSLHNNDTIVSLSYDLIRLQQEKDVLSKGLADCVTYLKALREKQGKNAYQLHMVSPASQKKKKRMQQTRRYVDIEIKHRERDEQAFLNNLQTCEANIFLTNMKIYHASLHATDLASTPTLYAPTICSYSGSETTDLAWEGWTDEAVVSPFQKRSSNPFLVDDVAPDACAEDQRRDSVVAKDAKRPPPLPRAAVELPNSLPVPPNTARSQSTRSSVLSAAAAIFQPAPGTNSGRSSESKIKRLSISNSMARSCVELLQKRRFTVADIVPILSRFAIDAPPTPEHPAGQTGYTTTPQRSLQKVMRPLMSRQRTNSL
ncbi:hypothetical protein EKO04_007242 [Ascochyta lentis]|uniref:Uncharacterized protein n=1 Tax=Ascochyta lentis TaxID=205686 RepID=A0A8H7MFN8_9PLEO|nr:hypothetical protein EKO04_007242 [Ascochyta lentis]